MKYIIINGIIGAIFTVGFVFIFIPSIIGYLRNIKNKKNLLIVNVLAGVGLLIYFTILSEGLINVYDDLFEHHYSPIYYILPNIIIFIGIFSLLIRWRKNK